MEIGQPRSEKREFFRPSPRRESTKGSRFSLHHMKTRANPARPRVSLLLPQMQDCRGGHLHAGSVATPAPHEVHPHFPPGNRCCRLGANRATCCSPIVEIT